MYVLLYWVLVVCLKICKFGDMNVLNIIRFLLFDILLNQYDNRKSYSHSYKFHQTIIIRINYDIDIDKRN